MKDVLKLKEEFLSKIQVLPNGCWYWLGCKIPSGYGQIYYDGKMHNAHRISMFLFAEFELESELCGCHHCDNPPCVNPAHLYPGTYSDNLLDASAKGRLPDQTGLYQGERSGMAVLTEEQVKDIILQRGKITTRKLAVRYGVSKTEVWAIQNGHRWHHVYQELLGVQP